jgi:hypothetical protein
MTQDYRRVPRIGRWRMWLPLARPRRCPFCGEVNEHRATVCAHCGRDMRPGGQEGSQSG